MSDIDNREFPRFPFAPGMWIKLVKIDQRISDFSMYQLIDISQSGVSFKSHSVGEFKRGVELYILEVESQVLEYKIRAIVRYVKAIDNYGVDFKVGVEFLKKI